MTVILGFIIHMPRPVPTLAPQAMLKRQLRHSQKGFALFFVMLVLCAVGLFITGLSYSRLLDKRLLKARDNTEKAKDIALFALDLALVHLEQSLGPNRTSTVPFLDKNHPQAYWTGVWERKPSGEVDFLEYLVPPQEPKGEAIFFQGDMAVRVPKVALSNGEGFYTYWIGDEGVKAKINLGEALTAKGASPEDSPLNLAYMHATHLTGFEAINPTALKTIQDGFCTRNQLKLSTQATAHNYHHLSWRSYGFVNKPLQSQNAATLECKDNLHTLDASTSSLSPKEALIQSFQALAQNIRLEPSPIIHPKPFSIHKDNPYGANTLKQTGIGPICTGCQIDFTIEQTSAEKLSVHQRVQLNLWNPYAIELDSHPYMLQILCNRQAVLKIRKASANRADRAEDKFAEQAIVINMRDSQEKSYGFSLLEASITTGFKPGETKTFILRKIEDDSHKTAFIFEEVKHRQAMQQAILVQEESCLLSAKIPEKAANKGPKQSLHAMRQIRRERIALPQQSNREPQGTSNVGALAIQQKASSKAHESTDWPNTLIRLNSAHEGYSHDCTFHKLHLSTQPLMPLLASDDRLAGAHVALQYRLNYNKDKPFQNNPRAFIPDAFENRKDTAWQWLWHNSQQNSLESLYDASSKPLACFDIGPLYSVAHSAHILLSLDPNSPMYAQTAHYHDHYYCDNALTLHKGTDLYLEGSFNINARSAIAWESLLQSSYQPALRPCGVFSRCQAHTPRYTLSSTEIKTLAQNIVDLLSLRPPFLSVSEWIQSALLDQALEKLDLPHKDHPLLKLNSLDLLQAIGPLLNARSDTFKIRAQGEYCVAQDTAGRPIFTQATCEALVQRVIEEDTTAGKQARFKILSRRWVDADKL